MSKGADKRKRVEKLHAAQGGLCHWCRQPMLLLAPDPNRKTLPANAATLEHLDHATSPEREAHAANPRCVAACEGCNHSRGNVEWAALTPEEQLAHQERQLRPRRDKIARARLAADGVRPEELRPDVPVRGVLATDVLGVWRAGAAVEIRRYATDGGDDAPPRGKAAVLAPHPAEGEFVAASFDWGPDHEIGNAILAAAVLDRPALPHVAVVAGPAGTTLAPIRLREGEAEGKVREAAERLGNAARVLAVWTLDEFDAKVRAVPRPAAA